MNYANDRCSRASEEEARVVREGFTEAAELKRVLGRGRLQPSEAALGRPMGNRRAAHARGQQALGDLVPQETTSFFFFLIGDQTSSTTIIKR